MLSLPYRHAWKDLVQDRFSRRPSWVESFVSPHTPWLRTDGADKFRRRFGTGDWEWLREKAARKTLRNPSGQERLDSDELGTVIRHVYMCSWKSGGRTHCLDRNLDTIASVVSVNGRSRIDEIKCKAPPPPIRDIYDDENSSSNEILSNYVK